MFSFALFVLSGVVVAALVLAKMIELRGNKPFFILRAVSKGDERAHDLYHKSLKLYSEGKVKAVFFVRRELPVRSRIYLNKGLSWAGELLEEYLGDIRNSRLIGRKEGISEFFKSISEVEKGGGELHDDVYVEPTADEAPLAYRVTPIAAINTDLHTETSASAPTPKPKKPRAPRKPKAKKIPVIEVTEY
jgi:hypothetical protein